MPDLPNPWIDSALAPARVAEAVAGPDLTDPPVPAADRFVLDELSFMEAIEPPPLFLQILQRAAE